MLQRSIGTLAIIGTSFIFVMLIQTHHLTTVGALPFLTNNDNNGYSNKLVASEIHFWRSSQGCYASIQPVDTIQDKKAYNTYTKSPCGSTSLKLSSSIQRLIFAPSSTSVSKTIIDPRPVIDDPKLKVETIFKGDKYPSSMAFLGQNDILLLQKNNGTVERIVNGTLDTKPLLNVNVATQTERGMLGVAVTRIKNNSSNAHAATTYVFLYITQATDRKTGDNVTSLRPKCNCVYRYELINDKLVNPKLLLSLPATPGPSHNGGKIVIGPDNNVYVVIGDVFGHKTKAQNFVNGTDPDGTGGILRVTQDGRPVGKGIIGDKFPLNLYYGYGIRNSFGIDFDPITKKLWDTENGPNFGDEINLVEPGFNSGWTQVQGIWKPVGGFPPENEGPIATNPQRGLVDFGGKGKYRPPELTWNQTVGPTALKFLNSDKLGKQYENDMFVGDFNNGNLYHFKLNDQRNGLVLLNDSSVHNNVVYGSEAQLPAKWTDQIMQCVYNFDCTINSTSGWQNIKSSFQVSTTSTDNGTWSNVAGNEIAVKPNEKYQILTHMKLNEFAIGSHIAIEGYNVTSKKWSQFNSQCPKGTNGPLEWHEYSCEITIPSNIDKIRPILNAGWSSQPGREAITWFDAIHINQIMAPLSNNNLVQDPNFILVGDSNNSINNNNNNNTSSQPKLPTYWNDPFRNCNTSFKCTVIKSKETIGWQNSTTSFEISTNRTSINKNTWSFIYGKEINVKPGDQYAVITHMKLNEFAIGSHIAIEGYNVTSKKWSQFNSQCPKGTNGPLEWHEYSCEITIPSNIDKIRPILNAGWSSQPGREAITWFDAIHINQIMAPLSNNNLVQDPNFAEKRMDHGIVPFGHGFGSITDVQVGPDGYLYILSIQMDRGYPYPTIYKIVPNGN